jgi:opacity protein-like surface antigen
MKKLSMVTAGLIVLAASTQVADLSGQWNGTGSVTDRE